MIKIITDGLYEHLEIRTDEHRIAIRQKQRTRIDEEWNLKVTILNWREYDDINKAVLGGRI